MKNIKVDYMDLAYTHTHTPILCHTGVFLYKYFSYFGQPSQNGFSGSFWKYKGQLDKSLNDRQLSSLC